MVADDGRGPGRDEPRWAGASVVSRRRLIERIRGELTTPLIVVTAPAGYGKSTLLREWAATEDRPVVELRLDASDDDPIALARSIAAAFVGVGLAPEQAVRDWTPQPSTSSATAVRLPQAVATIPEPFVLLIDDLEVLHDVPALDLISRLASRVPVGSHVVLAGRTRPPFVPRRRVGSEVVEVGPADLILDSEGTRTVFAAAGVEITPTMARSVTDRAEGWPAGIYLSALAARETSVDVMAESFVGADPFVTEYLMREVFEHLPPLHQTFLLRSALLDELSAPLCEQVTGIEGAQGILRQIEESNLFLLPLDRTRTWYRLHQLFRDFLLSELHEPQAAVRAMQRRAADWCRSNDRSEQAVEYLLRARASELLGPALCDVLRPAYLEGRLSTIERWLDACGEQAIEEFPPLAAMAGWVAAMSGSPIDAERWAAVAAGFAGERMAGAGFVSFESAAASLRALMCAHGAERMVADAQVSVDIEPDWAPWRNTVLWLSGQAHELVGDRETAARRYEESVRVDVDRGAAPLMVTLVSLATLAMDSGRWARAEELLAEAEQQTDMLGAVAYIEATLLHVAVARSALHEGDEDRMAAHLELAMAARHRATWAVPHAAVQVRLGLIEVHLALGRSAVARELVAEVDLIVERRPDLGVLVVRHRDLTARADGVRPVIELEHGTTLTPAEVRLLPYLPTHLTFAEVGEKLFVSRNTISTQVGSVYRKLGVSSRGEAVQRLRELGLTSETSAP